MPKIDFSSDFFDDIFEDVYCENGASSGNSFTETDHQVRFLVTSGSMRVTQSEGFRRLSVELDDCQNAQSLIVKLVIIFPSPQPFIKLHIGAIPSENIPFKVEFYRQDGGTGPVDLLDSYDENESGGVELPVYDNPSDPAQVVIIEYDQPVAVFSIDFGASLRDVSLALDGSGSMSAQNKWQAMIEAADVFHDLFRLMADGNDGIGGVRYRWTCQGNGQPQMEDQPPYRLVQAPPENIPLLFSQDAPAQCTPIGAGLLQAQFQLNPVGNPSIPQGNRSKYLVLMTDGKNNRAQTPLEVSNQLGSIPIHVVGLGSEQNIDPVEISVLAEQHAGLYQQTTDPSELVDFYGQILAEVLGKAAVIDVASDGTATIAPGTTKAVFLIAWSDPAQNLQFQLEDPGGTVITTAGASDANYTAQFTFADVLTAHSYYVVTGSDLGGDWKFASVPAGARILAIEDLQLKTRWGMSPTLGVTDEPIKLTSRVYFKGKPLDEKAKVVARVSRPDESRGDLIAQVLRKITPKVRLDGDADERAELIGAVLKELNQQDFKSKDLGEIPLEPVGPGVYRLMFDETKFDGVYRFDLSAHGHGDVRFSQRQTRCSVLVPALDGVIDVTWKPADGKHFDLRFTPLSGKSMLGPFLAQFLRLDSVVGRPVGTLQDNWDGSYTQRIKSDKKTPPTCFLRCLNRRIAFTP